MSKSLRSRLLAVYREVDDVTGTFLRQHPLAACDAGCADCCRTRPPLVSRQEAEIVQETLAAQPEAIRALVRSRARALVAQMQGGAEPDFSCPLLVDVNGVPRCAVYEGRPYACRTFGHTARVDAEHAHPRPFTCDRLGPRVVRAQPPPVPFRSQMLRELVGVAVVADSYLPIWVGLDADEQEERPSGPGQAVVVGRELTRPT